MNKTLKTLLKATITTTKFVTSTLEKTIAQTQCKRCGKPISPQYKLCYQCHERQKGMPKN